MYKKIIFIICMFGAMGMAFANNILYCDKIEVLAQNTGGDDKSTVINASISGHTLTVVFSQNLGDVDVEVLSTSGNFMHNAVTQTPTGVQVYIPLAGHYTVTFTLSNGDVYYGEFDVTEIDITEMPAGIYLISIVDKNGHKNVQKIAKK